MVQIHGRYIEAVSRRESAISRVENVANADHNHGERPSGVQTPDFAHQSTTEGNSSV